MLTSPFENSSCNKKVLLREPKRHTACGISSTPAAVLSREVPRGVNWQTNWNYYLPHPSDAGGKCYIILAIYRGSLIRIRHFVFLSLWLQWCDVCCSGLRDVWIGSEERVVPQHLPALSVQRRSPQSQTLVEPRGNRKRRHAQGQY